MSSSGFSATSGSRLFISMRRTASCGQPRQLSVFPRGARMRRGPLISLERSEHLLDGPDHGAVLHELERGGEVGGEYAVAGERGHGGADLVVGALRPAGGPERPVKVQRLGGAEEVDPHDLLGGVEDA